jgi:Arc/MetJ family transcription regulator
VRTNIEISDQLMEEALKASGLKTKRAVVEAALRTLIRLRRQRKVLDLAGKIHREGNIDDIRDQSGR